MFAYAKALSGVETWVSSDSENLLQLTLTVWQNYSVTINTANYFFACTCC